MFDLKPLPRSLSAALRDVSSPKEAVRVSAISDLTRHARSGEVAAAEGLVRALDDVAESVRAVAAMALADADWAAALPRLTELARSDSSVRVRQMALLALGELGTPEAPEIQEVLKRAQLSDAAPERFQSLLALHQLKSPATRGALIESSVDPDPELRKLAFRVAEAEWADEELPEILRARARGALREANLGVRVAAALLLGRFGDNSGTALLLSLVENRSPGASQEDQQAAIELCAELGIREAEGALERRAFGVLIRDPLAFDAQVALARLGNARARSEILRGLGALTFHKRTLAVIAAGRARLGEALPQLQQIAARGDRADAAAVSEAIALLSSASATAERDGQLGG